MNSYPQNLTADHWGPTADGYFSNSRDWWAVTVPGRVEVVKGTGAEGNIEACENIFARRDAAKDWNQTMGLFSMVIIIISLFILGLKSVVYKIKILK